MAVKEQNRTKQWCGFCCEAFFFERPQGFCSQTCKWYWMRKRRVRLDREAAESQKNSKSE